MAKVYAYCGTSRELANTGIHPVPYEVYRIFQKQEDAIRHLETRAKADSRMKKCSDIRYVSEDCKSILFIKEYELN